MKIKLSEIWQQGKHLVNEYVALWTVFKKYNEGEKAVLLLTQITPSHLLYRTLTSRNFTFNRNHFRSYMKACLTWW